MALNVGELFAKLGIDDREFNTKLDQDGRRFDTFGRGMSKAAGTAALAGGAAIAGMAAKGIAELSNLERGMNEVFTLLPDVSQQAMGDMTDQVRDFSKEFGTLPDEVVPSLYQAISAGVPQDNVFDFLETAQKAALGGVTELETAVDGISSVVNAYGEDVIDATAASDLMFTAVRLGKTDFEQLSRSLFNVIPTAASLGVEFGDITAALAAMTAQGTPTTVATTQLRQMLVELSKEGQVAATTFEEIAGQTFQEFIAEGGNVQGALALMGEEAARRGGNIADLFGSVEAGMAGTALTSESGSEAFTNALGEMEDSAGATEGAFDQMDQGISRAFDDLKARANDLTITFGEELGDTVVDLGENLLDLGEASLPIVEGGLRIVSEAAGEVVDLLAEINGLLGIGDDAARDVAAAHEILAEGLEAGGEPGVELARVLLQLNDRGLLTADVFEDLAEASGVSGDRLEEVKESLKRYVRDGQPASELTDYLGVGFGDLTLAMADYATEVDPSIDATATLAEAMEGTRGPLQDAEGNISHVAGGLQDYMKEAPGAAGATGDLAGASADAADAQGDLAPKVDEATQKLREQFDLIRAQTDPLFALREATAAVAETQTAVTEAAEEFGEGSPEHIQAIADKAEANADLRDAELGVIEAGELTRAEFIKQQTELGLTREEAELLADEFEELNSFEFDPKSIIIEVGGSGKNFAHNFAGPSGRQHGGAVFPNRLYEVGENNLPEVLQMGDQQFLIPGNQGRMLSYGAAEAAMQTSLAQPRAIAPTGGSGGPISYNKHIYLEGTGDPAIDSLRIGAVDSVTEFMETHN